MSAPVVLGCTASVVVVAIASLGASNALAARERMVAAADAAALAAADAAGGWIEAESCAIASRVARAGRAVLEQCEVDRSTAEAAVIVRAPAPFGWVRARARAGSPPELQALLDRGAAAGWVWPSGVRAITQDHHDGFAIDLAVGADGALLSPADGLVIAVGEDGGGIPGPCRAHPDWWNGPNHTVLIRHVVRGSAVYSSHNHIEPGSPERLGVRPGSFVRAGQRVAVSGMSGCTSGPHSHFTVASGPRNHTPDIDPYTLFGRP